MTFSGRISDPTIALRCASLLENDVNVFVWETALHDLQTLKDIFALQPSYGLVMDFETKLLQRIVKSIGWKESVHDSPVKHERSKLRGRILRQAIRNNHPEVTQQALHYFNLLKEGKQLDLDADSFESVYVAGVMNGKEEDYDFVLKKYLDSTFAPDQVILLHALSSTPTPYLQQRTLVLALSEAVRPQDTISVISNVAVLTPVGHVSVWLFFMSNWNDLTGEIRFGRFGKFSGIVNLR